MWSVAYIIPSFLLEEKKNIALFQNCYAWIHRYNRRLNKNLKISGFGIWSKEILKNRRVKGKPGVKLEPKDPSQASVCGLENTMNLELPSSWVKSEGPQMKKQVRRWRSICVFLLFWLLEAIVCVHTRARVQVIKCLPSQGPFLGTMEMILLSCL